MRGFFSGIVWGTLASVVGLSVLSLLSSPVPSPEVGSLAPAAVENSARPADQSGVGNGARDPDLVEVAPIAPDEPDAGNAPADTLAALQDGDTDPAAEPSVSAVAGAPDAPGAVPQGADLALSGDSPAVPSGAAAPAALAEPAAQGTVPAVSEASDLPQAEDIVTAGTPPDQPAETDAPVAADALDSAPARQSPAVVAGVAPAGETPALATKPADAPAAVETPDAPTEGEGPQSAQVAVAPEQGSEVGEEVAALTVPSADSSPQAGTAPADAPAAVAAPAGPAASSEDPAPDMAGTQGAGSAPPETARTESVPEMTPAERPPEADIASTEAPVAAQVAEPPRVATEEAGSAGADSAEPPAETASPEIAEAPGAMVTPVIDSAPGALPATDERPASGNSSGTAPDAGNRPRVAALPQAGADSELGAQALVPSIGQRVVPLTQRTQEANAAPEAEAADPPLQRFAAAFDNPDAKPLMSIILIDDAEAVGVEALKDFPYALSFAVDPLAPGAAEKIARHRAAGFEVLALIDLPRAGTAQDAEVALEANFRAIPEAVALLEGTGTGIQGNRQLSQQVIEFVGSTGRGLITQGNGLNTLPRLAVRDGVPGAPVFRDFDGAGQTPTVMRRFLDQAAFRAGQQGAVVMLGRVRPDTISALLLWGLQDRAGRVALAPASAVLRASVRTP